MTEHKKVANTAAASAEFTPMLNEATPPLCPAPMPRQTIVLWTPRLALTTTLRAVTELRRPQRVLQRATVSVPNADDPR
jgi:hypothetical protein